MIGLVIFIFSADFFGYYEHQLTSLYMKEDFILQDYNKLRFDISVDFSDKASLNGGGIVQTFHGERIFNLLHFLPDSLVQIIPDSLKPMYFVQFENQYYINDIVLLLYWKYLILKIGKQQLAWGTGYAWNPTEIISDKSLFDPTYERAGTPSFYITVPWGNAVGFETILILKDNEGLEELPLTFRVKNNIFNFNFALSYTQMVEESFILQIKEKKKMYGGEFVGEMFGIGLWSEAAYNDLDTSSDYSQFVIGSDYTFKFHTHIMAEYYHNGMGKTEYDLTDWQRLIFNDIQNMGQDYVFVGFSHPIMEFHNISIYSLVNLNDMSLIIMPQIQYNITQDIDLSLMSFYSFGDTNTEFANFGIKGGFIRLNAYF